MENDYFRARVCTLLGAFLVFFPVGVSMYWGNLSVYVISYILHSNGHNGKVPGPWIIATYLVCNNLGMLFARSIHECIGRRLTAIIAIFFINSGIFLSSVAIHYHIVFTCVTFGCLTGLGSGLLHSTIISDVIDWSGHRVGFLTQIITTAYNLGSVVINQCITLYVNPQNDDVDFKLGTVSYFSQDAILNSVPNVFLLLGAYTLSFQITGLLLMHRFVNKKSLGKEEETRGLMSGDDSNDTDDESVDADTYCNGVINNIGDTAKTTSVNCSNHTHFRSTTSDQKKFCLQIEANSNNLKELNVSISSQVSDGNQTKSNTIQTHASCCDENTERRSSFQHSVMSEENHELSQTIATDNLSPQIQDKNFGIIDESESKSNMNSKESCVSFESQTLDNEDEGSMSETEFQCKTNCTDLISPEGKQLQGDLTTYDKEVSPRQMFCNKSAYALLSVILAKHIAFLLLSNYYKTFGEIYIHDDHFLATLGTLISLTSITVKPVMGLFIDHFGIRTPSLLSILMMCITSGVYAFTPSINKWIYLGSSLLFEWSISAVSSCSSLGTLKILGKKYYTTNMGLLSSVNIVLDILAPAIIQAILTHYDWFALFGGTSVVVFSSLVVNVLFLPSK